MLGEGHKLDQQLADIATQRGDWHEFNECCGPIDDVYDADGNIGVQAPAAAVLGGVDDAVLRPSNNDESDLMAKAIRPAGINSWDGQCRQVPMAANSNNDQQT